MITHMSPKDKSFCFSVITFVFQLTPVHLRIEKAEKDIETDQSV